MRTIRFFTTAFVLVGLAACADGGPTEPLTTLAPDGPVFAGGGSPSFLFGFRSNGDIEQVDLTDGSYTTIGNTGFNGASGMATSRGLVLVAGGTVLPAGTHFGMINNRSVIIVDTEDGSGQEVVQTDRNILGRGIAFGPDGTTLYLIEGNGALSTIDLQDGTVTLVGNTGTGSAALEWDPDTGHFLAITSSSLYSIDPSDATMTLVGAQGAVGFNACTLTRNPDTGTWYTLSNSNGGLYTLDPTDGTTQYIGGNGLNGICGTAFAPKHVINLPPENVSAGGPYAGDEGDVLSFTGAGDDPEGGAVTFSWDFGDGASATGQTVTHAYADDSPAGGYTVTLTVTDEDGFGTLVTTAATIGNVAPSVAATGEGRVDFGESFDVTFSISDPGTGDSWGWVVDWGDGASSTGSTADQGTPVSTGHVYGASGDYVVTVTVTDDDGGVGSAQVDAEVGPVPIDIDIKPGSFPNSVNPRQKGRLPVAILTTEDFDATTVAPSSITLGNDDGADTGVARRHDGTYMAGPEDVDGDGDVDLVLHFEVPALVSNGDLDVDTTELVLNGATADGTTVQGVDSVRIPRGGKKH